MENQVVVNPEFLNTWKEIANYMGMGVRTVQRYEQLYGLPVRRVNGIRGGRGRRANRGPVISTRSEIDAWFAARGAAKDSYSQPSDHIDSKGNLSLVTYVI